MKSWFDSQDATGCLALAINLPFLVPLTGSVDVDVDFERLLLGPHHDVPIDDSWLAIPTTIRLAWSAVPVRLQEPGTADHSAAHLSTVTGVDTPPSGRLSVRGRKSLVAALVPVRTKKPDDQPLTTDGAFGPLDAAVWAIGDFVRAARLHPNYPALPDVTVQSLPAQTVPFTYARVQNGLLLWDNKVRRFPLTGPRTGITNYLQSPPSPADQQRTREAFADIRIGSPSFILYDLLRRADVALDAGQPENAVVGYAITCEYLVTNLALAVAWERAGTNERDAAEVRMAARALSLWNASMAGLLEKSNLIGGGHWNDGEPIIANWSRDVVQLRNRLVHRGECTTVQHAEKARSAAAELIEMIKRRLIASKEYPKTCGQLTGQLSVENYSSNRRRTEHDDRLRDEQAYLEQGEAFRSWRDRIYAEDARA